MAKTTMKAKKVKKGVIVTKKKGKRITMKKKGKK